MTAEECLLLEKIMIILLSSCFATIKLGVLFSFFVILGVHQETKTHKIIEVPSTYRLCKLSTKKIKTTTKSKPRNIRLTKMICYMVFILDKIQDYYHYIIMNHTSIIYCIIYCTLATKVPPILNT